MLHLRHFRGLAILAVILLHVFFLSDAFQMNDSKSRCSPYWPSLVLRSDADGRITTRYGHTRSSDKQPYEFDFDGDNPAEEVRHAEDPVQIGRIQQFLGASFAANDDEPTQARPASRPPQSCVGRRCPLRHAESSVPAPVAPITQSGKSTPDGVAGQFAAVAIEHRFRLPVRSYSSREVRLREDIGDQCQHS